MITVKDLVRNYGSLQALRGITFHIRQGELYGLLGPNGAGKTTAISVMSTLLQPDGGNVNIAGIDILQHPGKCRNVIGVVPQEIALYNELSALDNLAFWGSLYSIPRASLKPRAEAMLRLTGLFDRRHDKVRTYSGGMKRRINIAAALMHAPSVLFLDEPTVGIDPQSRNLIFEIVEQLHLEGMTIVYTTHYMEEAERLCDRVGIIDGGRIIAQGTVAELKSHSNMKESIMVTFGNLTEELAGNIQEAWKETGRDENCINFYSCDIKSDLSGIIMKCSELGLEIQGIEVRKVNLETIFLSLTGKKLRDR